MPIFLSVSSQPYSDEPKLHVAYRLLKDEQISYDTKIYRPENFST